ncbi:MAG: RluA family pseudouridine synthase [Kiritimatiellae bacterium]|nr:RluA family pseudouridine synthase [Kiritimatiellia bacterium]
MKPRRRIRGIEILHEDAAVIVVDKAEGVLSQGMDAYSVEAALTDYVRKGQRKSKKQVYLVHRLDRDTSGVMMVAKTPEVQEYFRNDWNNLTRKTYRALVDGVLETDEGVCRGSLAEDPKTLSVRIVPDGEGRAALTEWRVLERYKHATLVEVYLKSGRKHQIRVHFAGMGFPIVGDLRYGRTRAKRLMLHSCRLEFLHPSTHEWQAYESATNDFP